MGNIMKKWKGILAVILITGCLGGCSQFQAEHNAVKVKRDGSVQAAVIDTLDKSYYSEDELKQTIDDSVSAISHRKVIRSLSKNLTSQTEKQSCI